MQTMIGVIGMILQMESRTMAAVFAKSTSVRGAGNSRLGTGTLTSDSLECLTVATVRAVLG